MQVSDNNYINFNNVDLNNIDFSISDSNSQNIINDNSLFGKESNDFKIDNKNELTLDYMMIIGKYFKSGYDFINVMKLSKRYQDLVSMYHFNPISDTSLFENLETQHFYKNDDLNQILPNKFQYINWTRKYLNNETRINKDNKTLIYFEDYSTENNYNKNDPKYEQVFDNNVINKKSVLNRRIIDAYKNKLINDNDIAFIPKDFSSLVTIGSMSMFNKNITHDLKEVYFDDNIEIIPCFCFSNLLMLKIVKLPLKLKELRQKTFYKCYSLYKIYIPPKTLLQRNSLVSTNLKQLILSKRFTEEDFYMFLEQLNHFASFKAVCSTTDIDPLTISEGDYITILRTNGEVKNINIIVRNVDLMYKVSEEVRKYDDNINLEWFDNGYKIKRYNGILTYTFIFDNQIGENEIDY